MSKEDYRRESSEAKETSKEEQQKPVLGYRFGGKMSQEHIDEKIVEYEAIGWKRVESVGRLAFSCPDGRWLHTWDTETGRGMFIDAEWVSRVVRARSEAKQEDSV